ncbi:MAG: DUF721 domain-containing protein [Acidobacteria bacterium]|nr:DUF721 domain-containing protein [Acidobacteriota bacterium]
MERAGRILGKTRLRAIEVAGVKTYHLAPKAWAAAVGKTIAARTRPAFLDGSKLIVEVEDAIWRNQLSALSGSILQRLDKVLGPGLIAAIEFRVAPPRRQPLIARAPVAAQAPGDESDHIEDPVLRRLYRTARRRANA